MLVPRKDLALAVIDRQPPDLILWDVGMASEIGRADYEAATAAEVW